MHKRNRPQSSPGQSKYASLQAKGKELDAKLKLRECQEFISQMGGGPSSGGQKRGSPLGCQ